MNSLPNLHFNSSLCTVHQAVRNATVRRVGKFATRAAAKLLTLGFGLSVVGLALPRAQAGNDAYSPDATSGVFSTSFTLGTTTPTAGGTSAPASGDALYFGTETTGTTTVNNDLAGYTYAGFTFNAGASAFTIGGNDFTLSGAITNNGTNTETINNNIALAATEGVATSTGTVALGGVISGTGFGLTKTGAGVLVLSGGNTYSGTTTISAGTLRLTNASAVQNSAVANSATLDLRANSTTTFATGGVTLNNGSTINVDNNGSGTGQTLTLGGAVTLNAATTAVNVTSASGYTLALGTVGATGANGTQTFNAVGANVTITTYNGSGGGDQGLVFAGNGNFTIGTMTNGAANREINPAFNTSGTVTINGSTASNINNDTSSGNNATVSFNNGTALLDFSNLATPTNLITRSGTHATTFFVFGGGALSINGKIGATATSQNFFGGTTFNSGASTISVTNNGTSTTTLALNAITRTALGGTVDFSSPASSTTSTFGTNALVTTTTTTNVNGILGGYATVGGTTWAVAPSTSAGAITGLPDSSYSNTATTALGTAATTANVDVAAAGTNASTASQVVNSLRFNDSTGAATVDATNGLTLTTGGILVTPNVGNRLSTISGGTLTGPASADLILIQNNTAAGLTISSTITNNTATSLTKSGAGLVTLSNPANTYTGVTYLNGGTLNIAADASLGAAPAAVTAAQLTINGGTLQFGGSFNLATNRGITLGIKGGTIDTNGNASTYAGVIAGATGVNGTFTKAGTGVLTLTGADTYTGGTVVNGGTLALDNNNATTARLTATNRLTVNTGGILTLVQNGATASTDRINNAAVVTLAGGTINTGGLREGVASGTAAATAGLGALTLSSSSTLDFGSVAHTNSVLAFANSSNQAWSGTLTLTDFTVGSDELNFAVANGLTAAQLSEISLSGYAATGLDAFGDVTFTAVAVPEPSTWIGAALCLGVAGCSQRRRFRVGNRTGQTVEA